MKPLRIAFLTPEYVREGFPQGGLANYLSKVCPLLADRGHEPVVFLLGDDDREILVNGIRVLEVKRASYRLRLLPHHLRACDSALAWWSSSRRLARALKQEHRSRAFGIIQSTSVEAVGCSLVGRVPIPLIVRLSSIGTLWRAAEGLDSGFREHLTDWLEVRQIRLADGVFAPSQSMAEYVQKLFGVNASVMRTPYSIAQREQDLSVYEEYLAGKDYLLFFGKLNRRKGADILAEAMPKVFDSYPNIHVVFVGAPRSHGKSYGEYAVTMAGPKSSQVHVLGNLPRRCWIPIVKRAKLIVLPSRIDNYPNTCLEAQSLGKIVVGTRGSSLEEMIVEEETGFLAEPGSSASLATAIIRGLSLSPLEVREFGQALRRFTETRSIEQDMTRLVDFYRKTSDRFSGRFRQE